MRQAVLDDFGIVHGDLYDVLRSIGDSEDWDAFHRAAMRFSVVTGTIFDWHTGGYRDTNTLALLLGDSVTHSGVRVCCGDGGWKGRHTKGYISIGCRGDSALMMVVRVDGESILNRFKASNRLKDYFGYFRLLAEERGMELTGLGLESIPIMKVGS